MSNSRIAQSTDRRTNRLLSVATWAGLAVACSSQPAAPPPPSADAWAVVDGREIRSADVENAYRRSADPAAPVSEEEALTAKLSLLDELITEDILLAKALALNVSVPDAELDAAYAEGRKNITDEAFQQELARRSLTAADVRESTRRELLSQKVIEREIESKITVTDQDVTAFYNANKAQFNLPENSYHLAQIVVTPVREAEPTNRTRDDATTPEAAARKAQMLMERLKAGVAFSELALDYSEDAQTAARGGDLGFISVSALNQAPPALRNAVLKLSAGEVSAVSGGGAHTLVLLVAQEAAGQRDLTMPAVRDGITATLRGRKQQLLRTAYLSAARSDATVVNYAARRLLAPQVAPPGLAPAPPSTP